MFDLLFGTDGIRALIGYAPLTVEDLPKLGDAIATWAQINNFYIYRKRLVQHF